MRNISVPCVSPVYALMLINEKIVDLEVSNWYGCRGAHIPLQVVGGEESELAELSVLIKPLV